MLQLFMFISQQDRTEIITGKGHLAVHSTPPLKPDFLIVSSSKSTKKNTKKGLLEKCPFLVDIVQNVKLELPAFGQFGLDIQAHRMYSF